ETYQFRKEEEQYSRRVSMEEIENNDWNLNISRYVSTTQAEEIIDLGEVHDRLVDIDRKAKEAREKHNKFLRELGLREI
ncbi:MAG: N-6 DNA methylase, partial [Cyclobacteriaceae bacterium]|nr:N-6 DNA methylase [Cyclobacteriaceae bacterium]